VTRLICWIQPCAARTEVAGRHGGAIKIRVAARPVDGAANTELVRFLAVRLGVPRAAVRIRSGASGRRKALEVTGLSPAAIDARLGLTPP